MARKKPSVGAGYSGTPLNKKLGYKAGMRVYVQNEPADYFDYLAPLPKDIVFLARATKAIDLVHFFALRTSQIENRLCKFRDAINQDGMIWVSWPKLSSAIDSDIREDTIRKLALEIGLVDIKVCAIDSTWSGLKLVIRKELRR